MADIKFEMMLGMFFLKISNANVAFGEKILTWKSYTTNKALPITKQVQLVNPKEFVIAALDADSNTFVVYMAIWEQKKLAMDPDKKTQIKAQSKAKILNKAQVGALLFDEASTEVPTEYFNYSNVFLAENVVELPENTGMNKHTIKLKKGKKPLFGPFYSLGSVELEMLKIYIETNLANSFIRPSKSLAKTSIFFDRKPDRSLRLYMDYWISTI